jgi:hypothetical protein
MWGGLANLRPIGKSACFVALRSSREMDARKTTVQNQRLTQSLQGSAARPFSPGERIALNWFSKRFDATMRAARCLRENRSAFT